MGDEPWIGVSDPEVAVMWEKLKRHPWRLEIVPAVAFGWVMWQVWLTRATLGHAGKHFLPADMQHESTQFSVFVIGMTSFYWLLEMSINSHWVTSERRKRFSWIAVVTQAPILMNAFLAYTVLYVLRAEPTSISLPGLDKLALVILTGVGTTAVLEYTRRYVPREEVQEASPPPPAPSRIDGKSGYREMEIDWWMVATGSAMLATASAMSLCGGPVSNLAWALLAGAVFECVGMRTVSVGANALTLWFGFIPKRFRVTDIISCSVAHHETFRRRRDKRVRAWCVTDGRCVQLTMRNSTIYRIGAIRPSHICELLGLMGVARAEQPEP